MWCSSPCGALECRAITRRVWLVGLAGWAADARLFGDVLVLIDERAMLNRAVMRKFRIRLVEVQLSFTKL